MNAGWAKGSRILERRATMFTSRGETSLGFDTHPLLQDNLGFIAVFRRPINGDKRVTELTHSSRHEIS